MVKKYRLEAPKMALRIKATHVWHFQKPNNKNRTVCGIIIAKGRGYKYRNEAYYKYLRKSKAIWEVKKIKDIKNTKSFCLTCLGPMTINQMVQGRFLPQDKIPGFLD